MSLYFTHAMQRTTLLQYLLTRSILIDKASLLYTTRLCLHTFIISLHTFSVNQSTSFHTRVAALARRLPCMLKVAGQFLAEASPISKVQVALMGYFPEKGGGS